MLDLANTLPSDGCRGALAGRVFRPDLDGPSVVAVREAGVFDVTRSFPTMTDLTEADDPAAALRAADGERLGDVNDLLANTVPDRRDTAKPWFLAPIDLQVIKASGVTFAISLIERVIEEKTKGKPEAAAVIRAEIDSLCGSDLKTLVPGSPAAMRLKEVLIAQGAWSQYLEVGIGPDAEIFTKAPVMSAVGTGMDAGVHPLSSWNNPEPEVVPFVSSRGTIVGAALGNDVNLRDVEGRSALLLGKAKDNNASCAIGPFLRLFDDTFTYEDMTRCEVTLAITGEDGFHSELVARVADISRTPKDLVGQMINANHQYPDGVVLFLGAMAAPTADRDVKGAGFTHKVGDIVSVTSPPLGRLVNRMKTSDACPPWNFGVRDLMRSLARRGIG
jgi:fumarylacetoacetate (FAA) hydrolase family protein